MAKFKDHFGNTVSAFDRINRTKEANDRVKPVETLAMGLARLEMERNTPKVKPVVKVEVERFGNSVLEITQANRRAMEAEAIAKGKKVK
mgnify:CR=1 FL=1